MNIKKILPFFVLLVSVLLISACSGTSNTSVEPAVSTQTSGSADSPTSAEASGITGIMGASGETSDLSQVNLLLLGTLKLEDTELAVDAEQAAVLLPLWQAYRSLSRSDTAAEAEINALLDQIQATLTAEQMQSILALGLTNNDLVTMLQSLGAGAAARGTPNPLGTPGADSPRQGLSPDAFQGGGGGGGGMGRLVTGGGSVPFGDAGAVGGLGGQFPQGTPDPSMQATAQARFASRASQANNLLLEVLISNLEALTSPQP